MKKQIKVRSAIFLLLAMMYTFCGCQPAREEEDVIHKHNENTMSTTFTESQQDTVVNDHQELPSTEYTEATEPYCSYTNNFQSTDQSVSFEISIDEPAANDASLMVEVVPHILTEEDAKRVAHAVFGNADFYEAESIVEEVYSKLEIQQKLDRLLNYEGHIGIDDSSFATAKESFIKEMTIKLETAPVENPHKTCEWEYRKASYYSYSSDEYDKINTSKDNDELQVRTVYNGIPYLLSYSARDGSDYKISNIFIKINDGSSPLYADKYIFQNQLCATEKPKEEDVSAIEAKAADLLTKVDLGDWKIDDVHIETQTHNEQPEYIVIVKAVPSYDGIPAVRLPQPLNLKSNSIYASNYRFPDAQFKFSPKGDLLELQLTSPMDVKEVIDLNSRVLPFEELMSYAQKHLELSDSYQYDYYALNESGLDDFTCSVSIAEISEGLSRVKVPNSDNSYYYVPAIVLWGSIDFLGENTGEKYHIERDSIDKFPLITLNAVDGSIISIFNQE